jgi:glycosyltransferase involved in cell wall biosynthesis
MGHDEANVNPDVEIMYIGFLLGHGGDAMQMLELATGMAVSGRRVKLVVPELETSVSLARLCRERGLPVERTPWIRADALGAKQNPLNLVRLFQTYRAPIVHLHTGDICLPRTVLLTMRLLRVPLGFATIHSPSNTMQPDARARAWAYAAPWTLRQIICPSKHGRRAQISYGVPAELVSTIYNGVDVNRFSSGQASLAQKALGLGPKTPLVVFSSRLEPQKRPFDAFHAFQRVAATDREPHLVFVGRGALEPELRAAVQQNGLADRVHFSGFQTNIPDWLAAATVWYLPTESENFSVAILEALAAGCPILSTLCQGNDEVLEDGRNALTTAVGDVEAQAAALKRLLREPALRQSLGTAAQNSARRYSVEAMVEEHSRAYALSPLFASQHSGRPFGADAI